MKSTVFVGTMVTGCVGMSTYVSSTSSKSSLYSSVRYDSKIRSSSSASSGIVESRSFWSVIGDPAVDEAGVLRTSSGVFGVVGGVASRVVEVDSGSGCGSSVSSNRKLDLLFVRNCNTRVRRVCVIA